MHANNTTYSREEELLQINAAKLDPSCFAPLYDRYYKPVFLFIYKRMGNKDLTADLTAQVFLKAMLNIGSYQDRGFAFSAWLFRIAFNEMNLLFRKTKKEADVEVSETDAAKLMEEINENYSEERCSIVLDALSQLPEELSGIIELRFMQKLPFQDIATIFGITEANAKMKLYRAMEKLKVQFEKLLKEKE